MDKVKSISRKEAKLKAARFCAYQERTQQEVREKLKKLLNDQDTIEEIVTELILENFINEERFARTFTSGRFRLKKWGRIKIVRSLKQKGLTEGCILEGLKEIEEEEYIEQLSDLITGRFQRLDITDIFQKKDRVSKQLISKGYEPELVWKMLDTLYPR